MYCPKHKTRSRCSGHRCTVTVYLHLSLTVTYAYQLSWAYVIVISERYVVCSATEITFPSVCLSAGRSEMRGSCCAWTEDFLQNPSNPSPSNVPGIWLDCENNSVKIIFAKIFTRGLLCRRGGHIAISGWQSLSQSFGDTFFELVAVENSRNFDAVYSSSDISISVFGGHTDTSGCRSLSKSFMNTKPVCCWKKTHLLSF